MDKEDYTDLLIYALNITKKKRKGTRQNKRL